MGEISAARCRVCGGHGIISLHTLPEVLLYEWMEGYADMDTDDEWLEQHLKKLLSVRKKIRNKQMSLDGDEDDLFDEEDEDDI